jgi:metallo-beta-lactamase class B
MTAYNVEMFLRIALAVLLCTSLLPAQRDWDDPFPPHRIADNLYYVGSKGLSTYLVTTSKGHILINSSFERTVPLIRANVEKLGFRFPEIKILLTSHAHADHVAGNARVKDLSGAQVYVMQGDEKVVATGGTGQYLYKETWRPCQVDHVLHDGETVTLGEATLTAHLTPGHTRGCTTWTMQAKDRGKTYNVVIVGSPNVNPGYQLVGNAAYPEIAGDFARTFRVLKSLSCDIFLGAHGAYYDMEAKYQRLQSHPDTNPFVDPAGYQAYITEREKHYLTTLHQQQK